MEKGFVVINTDQDWCVIVPYISHVADLIGKDRRTVDGWMKKHRRYVCDGWMIVRGYMIVNKEKPEGLILQVVQDQFKLTFQLTLDITNTGCSVTVVFAVSHGVRFVFHR